MIIKIGNSFPPTILFFSKFFTVIGLLILLPIPILGFIILAISTFIWSTTYGFETNKFTGKFREYGKVYGIKWGEWKNIDQFPEMTILTLQEGLTVRSRSSVSMTLVESYYGVYLLTSSHRTKVLVNKFKDLQQATDFITPIALELGKEVVHYNPVISERTRARRGNH